jgi:hypothetical protein
MPRAAAQYGARRQCALPVTGSSGIPHRGAKKRDENRARSDCGACKCGGQHSAVTITPRHSKRARAAETCAETIPNAAGLMCTSKSSRPFRIDTISPAWIPSASAISARVSGAANARASTHHTANTNTGQLTGLSAVGSGPTCLPRAVCREVKLDAAALAGCAQRATPGVKLNRATRVLLNLP